MNWQRTENYDYTGQEQTPQTQPPPYPGYPQYPYYPPQYAPPYPPGPKKDTKVIIIVVVVVLILVVVLPIIIASVLYVWVSGFDTPEGRSTVKISATKNEQTTAYKITIASVSGGDLNLEDAGFELSDGEGTRLYSVHIGNANPTYISKGLSRIYPIPISGGGAVQDSSTGSTVTTASELANYEDSYLAVVDQNNDGKINANDAIWLYKDWTRDRTIDVQTGYRFSILDGDHELVYVKNL